MKLRSLTVLVADAVLPINPTTLSPVSTHILHFSFFIFFLPIPLLPSAVPVPLSQLIQPSEPRRLRHHRKPVPRKASFVTDASYNLRSPNRCDSFALLLLTKLQLFWWEQRQTANFEWQTL